MHLRPPEKQDVFRLIELFNQLGYPSDADALLARLESRMHADYCQLFVAEVEGTIAGVIVLNLIQPLHEPGKWGMISALVVDQALRSGGVGAALLEHAERHAKYVGCTHVELSSNESRTRAHQFYQRQGYAEVRKRFVKKFKAN